MEDEEPVVVPPKPSKLLPILMGVNLALTAFVGFRVMTMSGPAAAASDEEDGLELDEPGPVYDLEAPLVVNLNEPAGGRYLKAQLSVEFIDTEAIDDFKKLEKIIRDDMLRYLSGLSVQDIMGEEAKDKVQATMVSRLDGHLGGEGRVTRIFFSEFIIQ